MTRRFLELVNSPIVLDRRRISIFFVLIMLLGAWLRVDATLNTSVDAPLRADAGDYFSYAFNLRHHAVFSRDKSFAAPGGPDGRVQPDALRAPGYPFFLMAFASDLPTNATILAVTLAQALLGVLILPLTFVLARQCLNNAWSLLPMLLVAISPQLVNCGVYVLTESLFTFLFIAAATCMAVQLRRSGSHWLVVVSGMLFGAAALTRPTLNYLVPFLVVGMWPALERNRRLGWALALAAGFAAVTVPWALRNFIVLGGADPTLTINALVHGHYPWAKFNGDPNSLGYPYRFDPEIARLSSSVSSALTGIWSRIVEDPAHYFVWYAIGKPLMFLSWGDVAAAGDIFTYPTETSPYYDSFFFLGTKGAMHLTHWVWIGLALVASGIFLFRRPHRRTNDVPRLLGALFLYFILVHIVGFPIGRYSVPLFPVIFVLATVGLSILYQRRMRRDSNL